MWPLSMPLLLRACCAEMRFVALLSRNMSLKSTRQIKSHYALAEQSFRLKEPDALHENWNYNIFMYLDGRKTVAFAKATVDRGYRKRRGLWIFGSRKAGVPYVCLYSIAVADGYKGRGVCRRLLVEAVGHLKREMGLPQNTVLALHLSADDPMMYIAARVYYKLGFTRGTFSTMGPECFQTCIDTFMESSHDLYEIADDPAISKTEGSFLALYCELRDFGTGGEPPGDWMERGKAMMDVLRKRRAAAPIK